MTSSEWVARKVRGQRKLAALACTGEDTRKASNLASGNAEARIAEKHGMRLSPSMLQGEWLLELDGNFGLQYEFTPCFYLREGNYGYLLVGNTGDLLLPRSLIIFPNTLDAFRRRASMLKLYLDDTLKKRQASEAEKRLGLR